jgi:hypothetical protein
VAQLKQERQGKPFNYNGLSKKKTSNDVFFKELLVRTAGFEPTAPPYLL